MLGIMLVLLILIICIAVIVTFTGFVVDHFTALRSSLIKLKTCEKNCKCMLR